MDFRLLGTLEVDAGDGALPLGGTKQRAVLAHLVLRPGAVVSSERIIDAVWDEEPPAAARNVVQTYVSRLRKVLGADRLTQRAGGYVLHAAEEEIDARRFAVLVERARAADPEEASGLYREAEILWRGPALADLQDQPALQAEIAGLEALRLAALEERMVADLAVGRHTEVVPELEALTERYPVREALWQHLMTALYRAGRQADALAAYRRARSMLVGELGLEPGAALRRLEQQILRQDPALDVQSARGLQLIEPLGTGDAGVVHRAVQLRIGREVAVKVVGADVANDATFIRSFEAATQRITRLEHPHVVPLYDSWREPDAAYLVMRLLHGGNLRDAAPLTAEHARGAAVQLGAALVAAHRHGVVHGNITATNVLLDEDGNAYLSDFAIVPPPGSDARADVTALGRALLEVMDDGPADFVALLGRAAAGDLPDAAGLLSAMAAPPVSAPARNPYKGLRPFLEPDAPDFYGRQRLVETLVQRLAHERLLALVGPSGSGKSSVVHAGLVPALRADGWFVADMHPGEDPFAALAEALITVLPSAPDDLPQRLSRDAALPVELLPGRLLLVIDQFEELFLGDAPDSSRFLALVRSVLTDDRLCVVLTLRADMLDRPLADSAFAHPLSAATELVLPLTAEELGEAISGPAHRAGVVVEPGLLAALVADVTGQPGALPLMQFALAELFDRRDSRGALTAAAYREVGGVAGAVARGAEDLYAGLGPAGQGSARQLLLRLVDARADGFTRRRVRRGDLLAISADPADVEEVIAAFAARRLLAFDRDPDTREPTVEIAHDALLDAWTRLRAWVAEAREGLIEQERLVAAAREWEASGRDSSFLLGGVRLARAEALSATEWAVEQELVAASIAQRDRSEAEEADRLARERAVERRSLSRLRSLVAVLAVGATSAAALTVFAFDQRADAERERRLAVVRELSAAAIADLDVDAERSVLLALAAVSTSQSGDGQVAPEAVDALHRAVGASRIELRVTGLGGALDWSPDGSMFVTEGPEESGLIDLRDAETGARLTAFAGHEGDINMVAFSADGSRLATSGDDGAVNVWDPRTGDLVRRVGSAAEGQVWGVSFSPDGERVAASYWDDGAVRIFDVDTGDQLVEVTGLLPGLTTAFSPDGRRLVVPTFDHGAGVVIDARTGRRLLVLDGSGSTDADYSPDGRWISLAGTDATVSIHDARTGRELFAINGHRSEVVQADWSPDGRRVATGSSDGTAKVWDVDERGATEALSIGVQERAGGLWVAFSPDGERLMTGDQEIATVKVWDVTAGGTAEWATVPASRTVASADFLPGTGFVAVGGDGVDLWDSREGTPDTSFTSTGLVASLAVAPGTVSATRGTNLLTWNLDGSERFRHALATDPATTPGDSAWTADGRYLALAQGSRDVILVDRDGAQVARLVHEAGVVATAVDFSQDGRLLAVALLPSDRSRPGAGRIAVWEWRSGTEVAALPEGPQAVDFSPDGDRIAAAYLFGPPRVWNVRTGEVVSSLVGHTGTVNDVVFSPQGDRLATASSDGTVRLWDEDGAAGLVLRGHEGVVSQVAFNAEGDQLASASLDGTVRVWALDVDDLVEIASIEVTRELTAEECRAYPAACE